MKDELINFFKFLKKNSGAITLFLGTTYFILNGAYKWVLGNSYNISYKYLKLDIDIYIGVLFVFSIPIMYLVFIKTLLKEEAKNKEERKIKEPKNKERKILKIIKLLFKERFDLTIIIFLFGILISVVEIICIIKFISVFQIKVIYIIFILLMNIVLIALYLMSSNCLFKFSCLYIVLYVAIILYSGIKLINNSYEYFCDGENLKVILTSYQDKFIVADGYKDDSIDKLIINTQKHNFITIRDDLEVKYKIFDKVEYNKKGFNFF
ncbi:MAG: hypothetical protein KGV57_04615 [Fusobacterium sp.]|nr:hypothetical protein [Fusobacterium sp.]